MTNLISTPYEDRNAFPGFGYAGGVSDILSAYNGLHHRTSKKRYGSFQPIFEEQVQYLEQLKSVLIEEENKFFDMFGIQGKTQKEKFITLKQRIEDWNRTGAWKLINDNSFGNEFYRGLQILKTMAVNAEITEDNWSDMLDFVVSSNKEEIQDILQKNPDTNIAMILNEILQKKTFSSNKRSSLLDNLKISLDEKGNIKISSQKGKITASMQQKIVKELSALMSEKEKEAIKNKNVNYSFQKAFLDLFNTLGIDHTGVEYIKKALGDYSTVLTRYAFNSSESQIKGFLGEVYNNAFLLYMTKDNKAKKGALEKITPVGVVRNTKNEEIIIDTWLDGVGIQVKNYEKNKVLNSGFNVHKTYSVAKFITEVLQLPVGVGMGNTASVGDIILNLFTSLDYNQDYVKTHKDYKTSSPNAYEHFVKTKDRMDKQIENTKNLTQTFMPYIAKILGVDRAFASENSLFIQEKVYHNTFFNISGNYIPSSHIVQSIIDSLNKNEKKDSMSELVRAHFSSKHKQSGKKVWNPYITNEDVNIVYENRLKYVGSSTISYSITLDVQKLINNIYNY